MEFKSRNMHTSAYPFGDNSVTLQHIRINAVYWIPNLTFLLKIRVIKVRYLAKVQGQVYHSLQRSSTEIDVIASLQARLFSGHCIFSWNNTIFTIFALTTNFNILITVFSTDNAHTHERSAFKCFKYHINNSTNKITVV